MPSEVLADDSYIQQIQLEAREKKLSSSDDWHKLLHYKPALLSGYKSQADDRRFFNAEDGRYSPEHELDATIAALLSETDEEIHPQCRFPARFYWLGQQLGLDDSRFTVHTCSEMQAWYEELKPYSVDMIFPAAFINGPSSMFGHTLLRINSYDHRRDLPLVGYALNYAANADSSDNTLLFSIKGLVGGYPGAFSIVPYYEKLNEYRDIENRDIWEYSLNLAQDEVEQLLRHAWELRHVNFDYYYLTENCSYHMLSLIEVARPGLELTRHFETKAIPADTVRVIRDAGLVKEVNYRPSTTTVIKQRSLQLDNDQNRLSIALANGELNVDSEIIRDMPPADNARVLEQAYDYSRYLFTDNPSVRDSRARQNWELLVARSENTEKNIWDPVPVPATRPDEGHETARLALGAGGLDSEPYISLKLRPAYHDLLDPPGGYAPGAQINFLDMRARYFYETRQLRLDRLTVINVLSLVPRDEYFDPLSWGVDVGLERINTSQGRTNAAQLTVDGGLSYPVGGDWVFSGLLEGRVKAAGRLEKNYSAGAGMRLNLLRQGSDYSTQFILRGIAFRAGEQSDFLNASVEQSLSFGVDRALRLLAERSREYGYYYTKIEVSMHWYY